MFLPAIIVSLAGELSSGPWLSLSTYISPSCLGEGDLEEFEAALKH